MIDSQAAADSARGDALQPSPSCPTSLENSAKPGGKQWYNPQSQLSFPHFGCTPPCVQRACVRESLSCVEFMQRGLDSETKKQLEEEEKKIISEEHWYLDLPELKEKESFIIEEQSFLLCEDLLYGRMSFRGFNPEVEKLMLQMNAKNKAEEVEDETVELDVSDEEMARRYETLVGTIGKKFAKKRDRANYEEDENGDIKPIKAKKMFLKPQD